MNMYDMEETQEDAGPGLGDLLAQLPVILLERKWWIIIPTVLALAIATAIAFWLPKQYESTAILLVEAPRLPDEVIGEQADEAVAQRIASIRQQLINRPALIGMIEQNGLYLNERATTPLSEVVEDMRENITLVPQMIALGQGSRSDQTISVNLSYIYQDPVKTQAVAQQLMERVLELDSTSNAEQQTGTVQFLTEQQNELQRRIAEAEGDLSAFNNRFGSVMASGSLATIGGNGGAYDLQISNLEREIADLESRKRLIQSADTRDPAVIQAEGALAAARATYAETHPDVRLAKRRLEQAREFAKQNAARIPGSELDERIQLARNQIVQLRVAQNNERARSAAVLGQRSQAPAIEQQAAQLQQRVTTLYRQAEEISDRLLSAQASARAGEEQMGERLLVVDPPVIPDTPTSPNRPLIVGGGLLAGLLIGIGLAFALEILARPIRDPGSLAKITGERPLAVIPVLDGAQKSWGQRLMFWRKSRTPKHFGSRA